MNNRTKAVIDTEYIILIFLKSVTAKYNSLPNTESGLKTSYSVWSLLCTVTKFSNADAIAMLLAFVSFNEDKSC